MPQICHNKRKFPVASRQALVHTLEISYQLQPLRDTPAEAAVWLTDTADTPNPRGSGAKAEAGLPCAASVQELLSHVPSADCERWIISPPQQRVQSKGMLALQYSLRPAACKAAQLQMTAPEYRAVTSLAGVPAAI